MTTYAADPGGAGLLTSPVRRSIVDMLALSPTRLGLRLPPSWPFGSRSALTAAELAEHLHLHVTTVRFHLDQLVSGGILDARFHRHGVGRPRKLYALATGSLDPGTRTESLEVLTGVLASAFGGQDLTPDEAGARWAREHVPAEPESTPADSPGTWLAQVGRMVDVLQRWGYTPELTTSNGGHTAEITLDDCPFLELARSNPAVVCGIHRGLISGTLEQLGETDADVSLEPFVGPRQCRAHVTTRTPFRLPEPPTRQPTTDAPSA